MTKLTLPIQVGKKYVRRDGLVVSVHKHSDNGDVAVIYMNGSSRWSVWVDSGCVNGNKAPSSGDLIADYEEPTAEQPKGHPHAALMALYAQDAAETHKPWERWETRLKSNIRQMTWSDLSEHPLWVPSAEYRRKPTTIRIGAFDVPEPLREAPPNGTVVWMAAPPASTYTVWYRFAGDSTQRSLLNRGLLHLTEEAAKIHAKALLSFTTVEAS